jgi:2-isopropylmalate synthase
MNERVTIFDTTLRDGEQSPGCSMTGIQKLKLARSLAELGVDVIEAGFPAASSDDFDAVRRIAGDVEGVTVCALARCHEGDIARAARALEPAPRRRLHVFIATSPIHRRHKLGLSRADVIERAVEGVRLARQYCDEVEFSAEDAVRTEPAFLAEVAAAVIERGAAVFNVPDTVGYTTPGEMYECIRRLRDEVPGMADVVLSAHCHNDLGLAVANSLAAVDAGARQVECTINGIGERAGNAALEEVVMALKTRAERFGVRTGVETCKLYPVSRQLAAIIGGFVPRNKPIVGDNAFAHEAGIHQHGMLANRETYEIMRPEDVGVSRSRLVLGKHSGRHALAERLSELGFTVAETELERIFAQFKQLADRKRHVFDADLETLVIGERTGHGGPWTLTHFQATSGQGGQQMASASVVLTGPDDTPRHEAATGDGPVDAALKALSSAAGIDFELEGMQLRSITEGEDAQAMAELRAAIDGVRYSGQACATDIVAACVQAFVDILNRAWRIRSSTSRPTAAPQAARVQAQL